MKHHNVIVAAVDLTSPSAAIVLRECTRLLSGVRAVHVLGVVDTRIGPLGNNRGNPAGLDDLSQGLQRAVARLREEASAECTIYVHARAGDIAEEIVHLGAEAEADLIIVGSPLRGGTIPEVVEEAAGCTVVKANATDWAGKESAFVPRVSMCPECSKARGNARHPQWFCPTHANPANRRVVRIDPS